MDGGVLFVVNYNRFIVKLTQDNLKDKQISRITLVNRSVFQNDLKK